MVEFPNTSPSTILRPRNRSFSKCFNKTQSKTLKTLSRMKIVQTAALILQRKGENKKVTNKTTNRLTSKFRLSKISATNPTGWSTRLHCAAISSWPTLARSARCAPLPMVRQRNAASTIQCRRCSQDGRALVPSTATIKLKFAKTTKKQVCRPMLTLFRRM